MEKAWWGWGRGSRAAWVTSDGVLDCSYMGAFVGHAGGGIL